MLSVVRPVLDAPALIVEPAARPQERWLIVADLHLGLAALEGSRGVPVMTTAREMADRLLGLGRSEVSHRLVIAGDVKHPVVGTPRALRPDIFQFFSALLSGGLEVDVVLGNHDAGLEPYLPREVVVHPARGLVRDGVGIFHGHSWPSATVLRAPTLVVGHLHPGFRLAPSADRGAGKERCWVRVALPPPASRRRPCAHEIRAREIIVLPAFNPLAGTEALNRDRPQRGRSFLYRRFLMSGAPRAYLLDGTDLGPLVMPVRERPRAGSAQAVRGR